MSATHHRFLVTRVQTWELDIPVPITPADIEAAVEAITVDPSDPTTEDWSYSWVGPSKYDTEEDG